LYDNINVGFEVLTAVIMNIAVFWNTAPFISYVAKQLLRAGFMLA
jgi:hypothetical protein